MATRNGKIANLPSDIREQLNLRLLEGESGRELAAWLNALPEAQSVIGLQFNGSPISEVNLTHWRQGGYLQWLTERECFDSARALAEGDGNFAETGLTAERLLNILTLRYGELLMRWDFSPDESVSESAAFSEVARKARILQGISRSVLAIHRIQSQSGFSKAERERSSLDAPSRRRAPGAPAPTAAFSHQPPTGLESGSRSQTAAASDASPKSAAESNGFSTDRPRVEGVLAVGMETAEANGRELAVGMETAEANGRGLAALTEPTELKPDFCDAALRRFRTRRNCAPGVRPEILSGAISSATIPSKLSETPFKAESELADVLNAV